MFHFQIPSSEAYIIMHGEHSTSLVALSIVVAFISSYSALFILKQVKREGFFHKVTWIALASVAIGLGVWSIHIIGLLAYQIAIYTEHRMLYIFVSIFPTLIGSFFGFYMMMYRRGWKGYQVYAGVSIGLGISLTHYIGMLGLKFSAQYAYRLELFILSIVFAVVFSFLATVLYVRKEKGPRKFFPRLLAASLLTVAIGTMHYTGMGATQFYVLPEQVLTTLPTNHLPGLMKIMFGTMIGILVLYVFTYIVAKLDQYVKYRTQYYDALTSLPNRKQWMKDRKEYKATYLVAIVHIHQLGRYIADDDYKFSDQIIQEISTFIDPFTLEKTALYRLEPHRFMFVCLDEKQVKPLSERLKRIMGSLEEPMDIERRTVRLDAVCAVSHVQQPVQAEQLLSNVMAVLQSNYIKYQHQLVFYNEHIHTYNLERRIIKDIDRAIAEEELFIVYQPKVNPIQMELAGLEALVRWRHPELGMISPGVFIPVLEENNKIEELTNWVIAKVCRQIRMWEISDIVYKKVSINIPGIYLTSQTLQTVIYHNLQANDVVPGKLELEITETSMINDMKSAMIVVDQFRSLGLSVALDDFGTGLSSLSYLKQIPISTIKLDKLFIEGVPKSTKDAKMLEAIITLCHSLGLSVVMEGVELVEQVSFLKSLAHPPIIQGYYYAQPLQVPAYEDWIRTFNKVKLS